MQIKIFDNFDGELQALWLELEKNAKFHGFQSFEWQRYWYEQIGMKQKGLKLCIVVCHSKNNLRVILPLGIKTSLGLKVLEFLGGNLSDYSAPVLANDLNVDEFRMIWAKVIEKLPHHHVSHFRNMPANILDKKNFLVDEINSRQIALAFSATLAQPLSKHLQKLSKRMLKDNSRMIKKLKAEGDLQFLVCQTEAEARKIVEKMISQKIDRYIITGARNIFYDRLVLDFFKNFHSLLNSQFKVHISALILNETILATHLGFIQGKRFYYLMPTFNHDKIWSKYSLGRLHLEKLTCWAVENDIEDFDFTIGAEKYKNNWCDKQTEIYEHFQVKSLFGLPLYITFILFNFVRKNRYLKRISVKILNLVQFK